MEIFLNGMALNTFGNKSIIETCKTAFLCSRKIPANAVLKCYDWAIEQREKENCVISGFHSQLEKDVMHYLLKGKQPVILVLARGMKKKWGPEIQAAVDDGRMLIVSPFDKTVTRVTEETAMVRNKVMLEIADAIVVGCASPGGKLEEILNAMQIKSVSYIQATKHSEI